MNTPRSRTTGAVPTWPWGHCPLSAPARAFCLAVALLTAAVLLAPSPASAHSAGGETHSHITVQLSPSTITEGQTTTVGFSVSGTTILTRYGSGNAAQHNTAYLDVTKTAATPTATGAGAVNFGSNNRFSWTAYLNGRPGAGTLAQSTASGTVTITAVDDSVRTGTRSVTVDLTFPCTIGTQDYWYIYSDICPTTHSATLTIEDNDAIPISLALGTTTIAESGAGNSTTVRATLGAAAPATVLVAVSPTSSTDFTWTGGTTLTIASGATTSTNALTITATDDATGGNKTVTLTASPPSSSYSAGTATLTIVDDEGPPGVTLMLNPSSIAESGTDNVATVTARLTHPSSAATTLTVTPVSGAFTVGSGTAGTVAIAAGATTSTDFALVIAVGNTTDEPNRTATVTGTVTNARATADMTTMPVTGATLTLTDDDDAPTVGLFLAPSTVSENGGVATVAASLSHFSSEPSTVTVTPVPGAYTVGTPAAYVIPAGQDVVASGTATVLVTAVDNTIHEGSAGRTTTVTATFNNPHGAGAVNGAALILTDDETRPTAALVLTPAAIAENGGVATVTATLSGRSSQAVTLTVGTTVGMGADAADFTQSGTTLMIAAGATASTGAVTVTANDNNVATGSKQVTVSGTATGGHGVTAPTAVTLTLNDDDTPQATLVLTPTSRSITENGGVATVTATLDRQSTSPVTVTVSATAGTGAVAGDFTLSTTPRLIFAANATTSTGTVTITAVTNETDAPNKSVTVSGVATDSGGLTNDPPDVTLTITDDDPAPNATLTLTPSTIATETGSSTVQATLDRPSSEPTTVTVNPVAGAYTVGVGTDGFIAIAAGDTSVAGDVASITGVDDTIHQGTAHRTATVTARLTNSQGVGTVAGATLTLTDDETLPTVTLVVTPTAVTEAAGVARVTATLSGLSSQPTTLTVAAAAGTGAVAGDFTLSTATNTVLTIAAGTTTSTGTVTVTAVDNAVDVPDKQVTVTAMAAGGHGVAAPSAATLTLTDDDVAGLTVAPMTSTTLRLRTSEDGDTATVRVRLATAPTATVVLDLASSDTTEGTVAPATLTFTAMTWNTAQPVTLTGVDDNMATPPNPADGNQAYTVTLTANASSTTDDTYDSVMATVYATNRDNEFGLVETAVMGTVTEGGGTATFTVALQTDLMPSSAVVTVTVTSLDASEGTVAPSVLVFTTSTWATAQPVTVTGVDDNVDDGNVAWQVRLDPSSDDTRYNGLENVEVNVTTVDDDDAPTVTLVLTPPAITENGGVSTVTATLAHPSIAATAVTVSAAPGAGMDFTQMGSMLTIAADDTTSTGVVTLTARDNAVDAPNKTVTVTGTAANAQAAAEGMPVTVTPATLTLEDDDERGVVFVPPAAQALVVAAGGTATYTVALASMPTDGVTVTVPAMVASDAVRVTAAHDPLVFTDSTWNTAQTVTVTATADADAAIETVFLTHAAADGDYPVSGRRAVTVRPEGGTTELRIVSEMPDTPLSNREGHIVLRVAVHNVPVWITARAVVDPGELPPPAAGEAVPLLRFGREQPGDQPVDESIIQQVAAAGFRLGPAGEQTLVDSSVDHGPVPAPGLRLCLPVRGPVEREAEQAGRSLVLLRRDGSVWQRETGSGADASGLLVCGQVAGRFSALAVGYADWAVAGTVKPRTYTTGQPVNDALEDVKLNRAYSGMLTYTLTPAFPDGSGLSYTPPPPADRTRHSGTIEGKPTSPMAKQEYTLTVRDAEGDEVTRTFTIEVKPGIERRDLELVLAGIGRTLASDAVEILGSRSGPPPARLHVTLGGQVLRLTNPAGSAPAASPAASAPSPLAGEGGGEGAIPAAPSGPSPWQRVTGVAVDVARAFGVTLDTPALSPAPTGPGRGDGSTFQRAHTLLSRAPADARRPASPTWRSPFRIQPVSAKDLLARSAFELPLTRTGDDGLPTWTLWGRGAASGFAGQPEEGFKMDGTLYSGYLGLDYRPRSSLLMGLAVAHSTGQVDYERTGGTKAGVDVKLTSLLPYAHWQPAAGLGVWGMLGAGLGEMDLKAAGDPTTHTTDLTSWLGAIGGRQALTTWQGIDLAAKTDAFLTTVRSEAKMHLPEARGHAQRVRLLLEGQTALALSPGSHLRPRMEMGGRWDSGTAEQGLGLELGGGLAYMQTDWGLTIDMQGRYLLMHEDGAFEDWGASVNVRLDPGIGGEGAYLMVAPVWGQPGSGVDQLWGTAAAVPGGTPAAQAAGWRPANVEVDVGYGLALSDGRGLLTPYGGLVLGDPGTARYRLGSRWAMSTLLDLSIEGERAEQPGQAAAHSVSVRLGWQW